MGQKGKRMIIRELAGPGQDSSTADFISGVECTVGRRVCLQVKITHKREREMRYRIDDTGCQLADQVKEHMISLYCKYWAFQI